MSGYRWGTWGYESMCMTRKTQQKHQNKNKQQLQTKKKVHASIPTHPRLALPPTPARQASVRPVPGQWGAMTG